MRNKRLLRLCRLVRYYRVIVTPTRWQNHHACIGSYPLFWFAEHAAYFYLLHHPFATVWVVPRGPYTKRFLRRYARFGRRVREWRIDI
jgi:hypothetical protein